jgi:D-methionine transport system substrate-binding protein
MQRPPTRRTVLTSALGAGIALSSHSSFAQDKKEIRVGLIAGPYADQFKQGIQAQLVAKGYSVAISDFPTVAQLNAGLLKGALDINIGQTKATMDAFNGQNKSDLTELLRVPSAPMGLFSDKFKSLDAIRNGATIAVPKDGTNLSRALVFLQVLELIKLDPAIDPNKTTDQHVVANPRKFRLGLVDTAQLPRMLPEIDLVVSPGEPMLAAGRPLASAVMLEDPRPQHQIIAVSRADFVNSAWANDVTSAYASEAFRKLVTTEAKFKGFSTPPYWR